jgi:phage terminase large subunit
VKELAKEISAWRETPAKFVRDVFDTEPDEWQLEVLSSFPVNNRIAMKASKGVGKSTVLAWCAWNFLVTRLHPKIAATSISGDNLSDGLWTEMAKWQAKSPLLTKLFHWTKTRIVLKDSPEQWWMSARTWPKGADSSQQANTLAGLHADYLLFILDEVGGIPDAVMAAAEAGLASGIETKILMAGNPTHRTGPLYRACSTEARLWKVTNINSDPENPKRSPRVSAQWAKEQIEKYGADNPWVKVNVFGEFPDSSLNSLLGPDEVMAAMNRRVNKEDFDFAQKRLGVDVARFGQDRTVLFPRQGLMSFKPVEMRNARTQDIASRIALAKAKWGTELELVDGTGGFGAGVIDMLLQAGHSPLEIHFSGKADDSRFLNKRAEMWFRMSEWVKKGGSLPQVPEMIQELTEPTYTFQNGKFQIEPKEQIKERLGFSPDMGDALALTFSLAELPSRFNTVLAPQSKYISDYDPFDSKRL